MKIVNRNICLNHFFYFNKLLKFVSYRGLSLPDIKKNQRLIFSNSKHVLLVKNYVYFDFYRQLFFIYKLRRIIKHILVLNGKFGIFNKFKELGVFLQNLSASHNQLYFKYNQKFLCDFFFFKKNVKIVTNFNFNYIDRLSFLILFIDNTNNLLVRRKLVDFSRRHLPVLYLSPTFINNSYFLPCSSNSRNAYFWCFIIFRLIFVEQYSLTS